MEKKILDFKTRINFILYIPILLSVFGNLKVQAQDLPDFSNLDKVSRDSIESACNYDFYATEDDDAIIDLLKDFTALLIVSDVDDYLTVPFVGFIS